MLIVRWAWVYLRKSRHFYFALAQTGRKVREEETGFGQKQASSRQQHRTECVDMPTSGACRRGIADRTMPAEGVADLGHADRGIADGGMSTRACCRGYCRRGHVDRSVLPGALPTGACLGRAFLVNRFLV